MYSTKIAEGDASEQLEVQLVALGANHFALRTFTSNSACSVCQIFKVTKGSVAVLGEGPYDMALPKGYFARLAAVKPAVTAPKTVCLIHRCRCSMTRCNAIDAIMSKAISFSRDLSGGAGSSASFVL